MIFKVKNLSKKYGKNIVINNFSYEFERGLYLLTGKNGTGKSTLLKLIAGVIKPSNSNYQINRKKVAYLCEKIELLNDNVLSYLKTISRINRVDINLKELLSNWKIPNKNIMSLSNGNKQKIGLLMMYLTEAEIYLFDEPTNALDEYAVKVFLEYISHLILKGKIVIISTHEKDLFECLQYKEIKLECLT